MSLILIIAAVVIIGALVYIQLNRNKAIRVVGLNFYPVKSCAGTALTVAQIGRLGIMRDRQWIIVHDNEKYGMVTQREFPLMALIKPTFITNDKGVELLRLSYSGQEPLDLPLSAPSSQPIVQCDVWDTKISVRLYIGESEKWLQNVFGQKVLIGTVPDYDTFARSPDARWDPSYGKMQAGAYADDFTFLLTTLKSLDAINKGIRSTGGTDVIPIATYRPNIVVDGPSWALKAWAEDTWAEISIGDVTFDVAKPCSRCVLTTVDPATGKRRASGQPLIEMRRSRAMATQPWFGVFLQHRQESGTLRVGDRVTITSRRAATVVVGSTEELKVLTPPKAEAVGATK